ncbi:hypothetical protein ACJO2E_11105 [Marinobacter sp. M1N3S26]|uniref:hypothetical protein n=1 Tax=Marinobacter sp. M1N3S26 TaxID=3382299 RepID=UPI00387B4C96
MASFYDIDFTPSSEQEEGSVLEVQQADGPVFQIDDVEIDFSDTQSAAAALKDNFGKPDTVAIRLS